MPTIEDLGFDKFLSKKTPSVKIMTEDQVSVSIPKISSKSLSGDVPVENVKQAVGDSAQISSVSSAAGVSSTGTGLRLTSTIVDEVNPDKIMLAICEVAVYQDNAGQSASIIPYGSDTIATNYRVTGYYDLHANLTGKNPGKSLSYVLHVQNLSAGNHTLYFYVRWRFLGNPTA